LEVGPEPVAASFAEPIQGAGGFKMPPRGYFAEKNYPATARFDLYSFENPLQ
jgi:4-aminobutyrate aminotransferase-like enzyme